MTHDFSLSAPLARFVANATAPEEIIETIRLAWIDTLGCVIAGQGSDPVSRARSALANAGVGEPVPAPYQAYLWAIAGHAWDLDDWEEPGNTHPSIVIVPSVMALAQRKQVSGAQAVRAYAVGFETIARLGEAMTLDHYARGFHSTATLGSLGAAAAAARVLNLPETETKNALCLAASMAIGYTVQFGSNAKPLQAGLAARAGVEAALLAQAGMTAQSRALDDPRGLLGLLGAPDDKTCRLAIAKLGQPWALLEYGLIVKPWPSCGYTHRLMTAALSLRDALEGKLDQITRIDAVLPDFHREILPFDRPSSRPEALFSAPACIAQMLLTGSLTLEDSADQFWRTPAATKLIETSHITAEPARNPKLNYDPDQPDRLAITVAEERLEASCAYPLGAPQNPMTDAQHSGKFRALTGRNDHNNLLGWIDTDDIGRYFKDVMP